MEDYVRQLDKCMERFAVNAPKKLQRTKWDEVRLCVYQVKKRIDVKPCDLEYQIFKSADNDLIASLALKSYQQCIETYFSIHKKGGI